MPSARRPSRIRSGSRRAVRFGSLSAQSGPGSCQAGGSSLASGPSATGHGEFAGTLQWMQQREQIGSFWHDGLVPLEPGSGGAGWQREQHSQAMLVGNAASPVHSANGQALSSAAQLEAVINEAKAQNREAILFRVRVRGAPEISVPVRLR